MIISSLFIWLTFYEYILKQKKRSKIIDIKQFIMRVLMRVDNNKHAEFLKN